MDTTLLLEAASRAGVAHEALIDAVSRGQRYFADLTPTVAEADSYYQGTLRDIAPHLWPHPPTPAAPAPAFDPQQRFGVPPEVWQALSVSERLTRARAGQPPPGPRQRPGPYIATPEEQKGLEGKSAAERLAWARERAAEQARR